MKAEELACVCCDSQLSTAFLGKADAEDWDTSRLVCVDHTDDVEGYHLLPKE